MSTTLKPENRASPPEKSGETFGWSLSPFHLEDAGQSHLPYSRQIAHQLSDVRSMDSPNDAPVLGQEALASSRLHGTESL
jgi:hypothetical protein